MLMHRPSTQVSPDEMTCDSRTEPDLSSGEKRMTCQYASSNSITSKNELEPNLSSSRHLDGSLHTTLVPVMASSFQPIHRPGI